MADGDSEPVTSPRRYWWVNQGRTYNRAKEAGCIWALKTNKTGAPLFHWENMTQLSTGDLVFNYADSQVRAVSLVKAPAYDSDRGVLSDDWGKEGRRADLDYFELPFPIHINRFATRLRDLNLVKGPIDRKAGVNQGYLFEISRDAVRLILGEIGRENIPPDIVAALDFQLGEAPERPPMDHQLRAILARYHQEQIIFCSSARQQRYAITSVDESGVEITRLDADEPAKLTWSHADRLIAGLRDVRQLDFQALDGTSAIRNAVLQAEPLSLSGDRKRVSFLHDTDARVIAFIEILRAMRTVKKLYKPAMLLCVLEGVETGDLTENKITFDWIAPRFLDKMRAFRAEVTEREAALPFYHLTSDLVWLHAVNNLRSPMIDGGDGPRGAREKVKYALLKDSYWNLLQDPLGRQAIRRELESLMGGNVADSLGPTDLLARAESALTETGFVFERPLLRRLLSSIAAKQFVILTGNSGTGKTKLAELVAEWLAGSVEGEETGLAIVPVGADWTDTRNVVGFVNHLRKGADDAPLYQSTAVLDLIVLAANDTSRPHFLILDEMNLSHVERYFSDFLSAMESRKAIPLHQEQGELATSSGLRIPRSLEFPDNLFILGTVNVDETTYMFSPKVLDRANVIEFRISPEQTAAYLTDPAMRIRSICPDPRAGAEFLELSRRARGLAEPSLPPPNPESMEECRRTLQDVFVLLHSVRLEFAYRTLAEALRYVHADTALQPSAAWSWKECIDAQVIQKILPKLHGSRRRLEPLLVALATYCQTRDVAAATKALQRDANLASFPLASTGEVLFPLSHRKLVEMIDSVRRDQFVSFIQ